MQSTGHAGHALSAVTGHSLSTVATSGGASGGSKENVVAITVSHDERIERGRIDRAALIARVEQQTEKAKAEAKMAEAGPVAANLTTQK